MADEASRAWISEDVPSFDVGGAVVGDAPTTAFLFQKAKGVLAGCPFFDAVFEELGCRLAQLATFCCVSVADTPGWEAKAQEMVVW